MKKIIFILFSCLFFSNVNAMPNISPVSHYTIMHQNKLGPAKSEEFYLRTEISVFVWATTMFLLYAHTTIKPSENYQGQVQIIRF
jgi:hypothetical protein